MQAQKKNPSCSRCAEWNKPQAPFRIYGNTYYVGPHGLTVLLITSKAGHVLIDGALEDSVPQIVDHIRSLGFRIQDVKLIINSHVHFDHAGGIAELQRLSGAQVAASEWSAGVLTGGGPGRGDPQAADESTIATVKDVRVINDGEKLRVGDLEITSHFTPGHTPGGTSWTWRSCQDEQCLNMVYADSVTPAAEKGFKFSSSKEYPTAVRDFEKSFAFLNTTPCDILITTHPEASDMWGRIAGRERRQNNDAYLVDPMIDGTACRRLSDHARSDFQLRLEREKKGQAAQ